MVLVMTQVDSNISPYLANAYANDRAHVFHSWSAQSALKPTVIAGAKGSRMWDDQGHSWLDFSSQLVNVNIGHQHPKLVAAIQEQAARLCTIAPFHANDMRSEAARLIAELAPGDLDMVFFPTAAPKRSRTRCAWRAATPAATRCCRRIAAITAPPATRSC